jgi:hypothetical protein
MRGRSIRRICSQLPSLCPSPDRTSKYCECSFCTKNLWHRTLRQCSEIRRSMSSLFNMPDPPRFWLAENPCILRQCAFIVFIPRQTYGHSPSSNPHLIPSSYDANSSMGQLTNGGTTNSLGYCATPAHPCISSHSASACFLANLCCLFVKWPTTWLGHTAYRHSLHTTTCHTLE